MNGNIRTSLMCSAPVSIITIRSIPMPHPPAGGIHFRHRLPEVLGGRPGVVHVERGADVHADDAGPFRRQAHGMGAPLSPRRPGDEGHLSVEPSHARRLTDR